MKRHFSNRGEALAEVAAARSLTERKTSSKTIFRTKVDRRAKSQSWFPQSVEVLNRFKANQPRRNDDISPFPKGVFEDTCHANN